MFEQPIIGVIIPIYKHAGLVPEAISSALAQATRVPFVIVLVNDGCPFPETNIVCQQYAASHPGKIYLINKPNGGLSSARNAGIAFCIRAFASMRAVYLMDADNRI